MVTKVCSGHEEFRRLGMSDELGIVEATSARNKSNKLQLHLLHFRIMQHELKGENKAIFNTSKAKLPKY